MPAKLLPELVPLVFEHLSQKDLDAASLVCKDWTAPAQKWMHEYLYIATNYNLDCAERVYSTYPHLALHVKDLELRLEQEFPNPDTIPVRFEEVKKLLPLFKNVRDLIVSNLVDLDAEKRAIFGQLSQLTELSFTTSNPDKVDQHQLKDFHDALKSWPNLRILTLRSFFFAEHDSLPSTPCPASFSSLYLFGSFLKDDELRYLVSGSESLEVLEYVQLELKGAEMRDFSAMVAVFAAVIGVPVPPQPIQSPPTAKAPAKASPDGLVALVAAHGNHLRELYVGVEDLKPSDVAQILSCTPQLEGLAIPIISLDSRTLASAPFTLRTLQLYLLPGSEVITEEATKLAVGHMASMDFGSVDKIVLSNIFGGLEYESLSEEVCRIAEEKGVEVWRQDRYFHQWSHAIRLSPALSSNAAASSST